MDPRAAPGAMRLLVLLAPFLLLAGCTQLEDARAQLDEATAQLNEARREAQEAQDRLERVRSATVVRVERADVRVHVVANSTPDGLTEVSFRVEATRGALTIPEANITAAPLVAVRTSNETEIVCDPVDCVLRVDPGTRVLIGWADEGRRDAFPPEPSCSPPPMSRCAPPLFPPLYREGAQVVATTRVGDVTE